MKSPKSEIQRTRVRMLATFSLFASILYFAGCGYEFSLNAAAETDSETHTTTDTVLESDTLLETDTESVTLTSSDTDTDCGSIDCIDNCLPDPCVKGKCLDGDNSYTCLCDDGWTGKNCDRLREYFAIYQAESRTAEHDVSFSSASSGYMGTGYMDYGGSGAWLEWNNVEVPWTGSYTLKFRYTSSFYDRPCILSINGVDSGEIPFNGIPGATWSDWTVTSMTVPLSDGTATIRVTSIGAGPNLDEMTIERNI